MLPASLCPRRGGKVCLSGGVERGNAVPNRPIPEAAASDPTASGSVAVVLTDGTSVGPVSPTSLNYQLLMKGLRLESLNHGAVDHVFGFN